MVAKIFILVQLGLVGVVGCAAWQPLEVQAARTAVTGAWQADRHTVWELDWPNAPAGGPVTVETWQAGGRYRFEILESAAPALAGEVLVFDGQQGWRYNRFDVQPPRPAVPPQLSPITEALARIDRLLTLPPVSARQQETSTLDHGPVQKIELALANGEALSFWLDVETGLPVRVIFTVEGSRGELKARQVAALPDPPAGLFEQLFGP